MSTPANAVVAPLQTLGLVRDIGLRMPWPEALGQRVGAFLGRVAGGLDADAAVREGQLREGLGLVEALTAHLDREVRQVTEDTVGANHRLNSQGAYANQLQGEVSKALQEVKSRLDEERQKFGPRFSRQHQSGLDALKATVDAVETDSAPEEFGVRFTLAEGFRRRYERWAASLFGQWGQHTAELLQDRAARAIEPPMAQLVRVLATPIAYAPGKAAPIGAPAGLDVGPCEERAQIPSWGEAYKESLFTGLGQMSMLAGMVIIPVVGNFSQEQPTALRVVVMTGAVAPIILFAFAAARRSRRKHLRTNTDRALQAIQRQLQEHFRSRVERFKVDYETAVAKYLKAVHDEVTERVQRLVQELLEGFKRRALDEQTRVRLELDQLQERLGRLRQARGQLVDQVRLELLRRLQELGAS